MKGPTLQRVEMLLQGGCKQKAKCTLLKSTFFPLKSSMKIYPTRYNPEPPAKRTLFSLLHRMLPWIKASKFFSSARASTSSSLSSSLACARQPCHPLWEPLVSDREEVRLCVGEGEGVACVAIETQRYQLYQPPCLTQIFFPPSPVWLQVL